MQFMFSYFLNNFFNRAQQKKEELKARLKEAESKGEEELKNSKSKKKI